MQDLGLGPARFYWAGRELSVELAAGAEISAARATVRDRCGVTDAQLDYIVSCSRPAAT